MFKCTSGFHFFTDRMFCFSAVCKSKFHSVWTWFQSGIYFFTSPECIMDGRFILIAKTTFMDFLRLQDYCSTMDVTFALL